MNVQLDTYSRINKAYTNYKKSPKERITVTYLEARLETLEKLWHQFSSMHEDLVAASSQSELRKSDYVTQEIYDVTDECYHDYKCELKTTLKALTLQPSEISTESSPSTPSKTTHVRLPKITIPMFSGQYSEWISFRDLFVSLIHDNADIDDVQKMHYLKGHLRGEAEQLLRHIPITNSSYQQCWTLLNNRYNNKQYLVNSILNRFFNQRNVSSESASAIKGLLDVTTETINALSGLGIVTESWSVIIIYIVSQRLDPETRKQWEAKVSAWVAISDQLPSMKQFTDFLETRFHSLEFLDSGSSSSFVHKPREFLPKAHNHNVPKSNPIHMFHVSHESCAYCKQDHNIRSCADFIHCDLISKRNFVQTHGLCFNCLGNNHSVKYCKSTASCQICKRRHHSLLHPKGETHSTEITGLNASVENQSSPLADKVSNQEVGPSTATSITNYFVKEVSHQVLLATAVVKARSQNNGEYQLLRALIDQGSQASFITRASVQLLGLKTTATKGVISGLGGEQGLITRSKVEILISSRLNPACVLRVSAYVLDKLTSYLPSAVASVTSWPELEQLNLADPEYHTPNKIDILLGADVYSAIIENGLVKCPSGFLVAQNTTLGWILCGQLKAKDAIYCNVVNMHTQVDQLLRSFWEIESEPCNKEKILSVEEQRCEEFYEATTTRDEHGRYVVKLPFRDENPACADGHSKEIAMKRFCFLERKLQKDQHLKQRYKQVLDEYLSLGHMEQINQSKGEQAKQFTYLPHHAVIREDKETTKVRIVFDASCKGTNRVSLNDDLMVGPTLQPELRHIIMRWRTYPICFIADIVKMYRQIKVHDEDAEYQRILWRDIPNEEIREYKLLRVTFGTSAAPYLAVKSLIQVAKDEGKDFPLAADRVKKEFYMDDLMSGCEKEEEAVEIYKQMTELLSRGGFELQKWASNSQVLLDQIQNENLGKDVDKRIEVKQDLVNKILGLTWSRSADEFVYVVQLPPMTGPVTKRQVISDISKLYDPQGWIAPSIIKAKIFIQKLWLAGIDWDEELSFPLLKEWLEYRENLSELTKFRLNRWMRCSSNATLVELHGFCDASNSAYAAVIYIRVIDAEGKVHVSLVTAKTRVAPIKQISVPRLELSGAVLLAKLLDEVSRILNVSKSNLHAWTDSEVVLAWLSSHPSRWKTFVGNRVSEILSVTCRSQWSHVRSEHNPADCASRGIQPSDFVCFDLWVKGPSWLQDEIICYRNLTKPLDTNLEIRTIQTHLADVAIQTKHEEVWSKFSSLTKLLRVVAYCRRMQKRKNHTYLLKEEIDEALLIMIRKCQEEVFREEITNIKQGKNLSKKSILTSLTPQLDDSGLLRVGGRLHFADINDDLKHPIILPKQSFLTELIIRDAHKATLHGGVQLMLNLLRSKYWILSVKTLIKQQVRKCVTCTRYAIENKNQLMGQLPSPRVTMSRAFQRSGVDYAGPINIRISKGRGNRSYKGYICLFVCMATRGIHLEVVSDLTTQGFLAAFKRFVARRGHCSDIYSDNGTNFVGAAKELQALFNNERSRILPEIADWLATNGTQWHFIPPHAPNFGGLWEAGVKSCKYHLKRIVGNSTLTFEELSTVLAQIESCLNSRPMCYIQDQGDPMPLTPGHFLVGEPLLVAPDRNFEHSSIGSLRRWQLCQRMLQDFWRRWSQEYLARFMQRYKWSHITPEPKVGDVVLVKELDLPPARWLFGQIVEKHPGLDNVTRVVTLRCKGSLIKRPVSKICLLPVSD